MDTSEYHFSPGSKFIGTGGFTYRVILVGGDGYALLREDNSVTVTSDRTYEGLQQYLSVYNFEWCRY
mgnify:CR=1 FL=1